MKNIIVINAIQQSEYASQPVIGSKNSMECQLDFIASLPDVHKKIMLKSDPSSVPEGIEPVIKEAWDAKEFFNTLIDVSKGYDNIFYFFGDTPLLDAGIAARMYDNHLRYFAEYTFADGYPYGLAIEIVKPHILPALAALEKNGDAVSRDYLFTVIKRDINSFDLETELSPVDLRLLRISLSVDTKRNTLITQRVIEAGGIDEKSVCAILQEKPELLRPLPAYIQVQTVEGCRQKCSYCPYPKMLPDTIGKKAEMPVEKCLDIAKKAIDFCEDITFSISLWGEPSLHSDIYRLIRELTSIKNLKLVIETSGIGWDKEELTKTAKECQTPPLWIVSLDANNRELYTALRGDGYEEAHACARLLLSLFPGNAYVQAVRMKESEEHLEQFYREWKKETEHLIIQKYDPFAGFLPDKKVTDLSPLHRFPCWHNKREIAVLLDGTVPLCREDVEKTAVLGNIFTDSIETIWAGGADTYTRHGAKEYPGICKGCDEYYTYNF
ncbi:MAG: spiro-SPASM protein [Spirochaetales bacterium]|nr:spiro-SPASM protein [Spirochaetales bacterium]